MTTVNTAVDNGVNVGALLGVRTALTDTPEIAQFQWRTTVSWINGTHSRSTSTPSTASASQQQHKTEFTYDADHPLAFAAEDNGATPVEYRPGRPRQLPDRGHRIGRPAAQHSAAFCAGAPSRPSTTYTESSVPTPTSAMDSAASR